MKNNLITKLLRIVVLGLLWCNVAYSQDCTNINLEKPEYKKVIKYLGKGFVDCMNTKGNFYAMDGNLYCDRVKKLFKEEFEKKKPSLINVFTSKIMVYAIKASFPDLENTLKSELKHPDKNVESFLWCALNNLQDEDEETLAVPNFKY